MTSASAVRAPAVLGHAVQLRVRDFGIRRALGASTADVITLALGSAVRMIAAGTIVGLIFAALRGRLLSSVLVGVQPLDALTFVSVTLVLALSAALAMIVPAWNATRVDPAIALREG